MKIRLHFKTPDVVCETLRDDEIDSEEIMAYERMCRKFIEYGEYLTVEISDESGEVTATVVPVK
jgi:hypothetical protein